MKEQIKKAEEMLCKCAAACSAASTAATLEDEPEQANHWNLMNLRIYQTIGLLADAGVFRDDATGKERELEGELIEVMGNKWSEWLDEEKE